MSTVTILLIFANVIFSYKGYTSTAFFERYKFQVEQIRVHKHYIRLISSGFLHLGWLHLLFNMLTLYFFGPVLEITLGPLPFLVVYFASLIGGNLLSLLIHKHNSQYSAVGASGAVCGVIFACVAIFPGMPVGIFFIAVPAWLYALVFVGYAIYGIKSAKDNIGHDAHLGGALIGMATALIFSPSSFADNYVTILLFAVPTLAFIYLIVTRPHILYIDSFSLKPQQKTYSIDHRYNFAKTMRQKEIDRILDKINRTGYDSLSKKEKEKLMRQSRDSR